MAVWKEDYQSLHQNHDHPITQRRQSTAISVHHQLMKLSIDNQQLTTESQAKDKGHMG